MTDKRPCCASARWHRDNRDALAARLEAAADWLAQQEAEYAKGRGDSYSEGARDAYDLAEQRVRDALKGDT